MNNFIRLVLFVFVQACFQSSFCSDWKNSVVKLENNVVKNTVFKPQQGIHEQFFRIPPNHVPANVHNINGELPHIQQEPIVPVISVQPSNMIPQVPFYQAHQENHFAQHTSEQLAVINPKPVIVAEPAIEPFPIQQPVVSATGEVIIEQTIGGIPFDCRMRPTGHWRDPRFCDVFHACVYGYHRKTYSCPIVGERTYFDEVTQRCEFVHLNPKICSL